MKLLYLSTVSLTFTHINVNAAMLQVVCKALYSKHDKRFLFLLTTWPFTLKISSHGGWRSSDYPLSFPAATMGLWISLLGTCSCSIEQMESSAKVCTMSLSTHVFFASTQGRNNQPLGKPGRWSGPRAFSCKFFMFLGCSPHVKIVKLVDSCVLYIG